MNIRKPTTAEISTAIKRELSYYFEHILRKTHVASHPADTLEKRKITEACEQIAVKTATASVQDVLNLVNG